MKVLNTNYDAQFLDSDSFNTFIVGKCILNECDCYVTGCVFCKQLCLCITFGPTAYECYLIYSCARDLYGVLCAHCSMLMH